MQYPHWTGRPPCISEEEIAETLDYDVVILGGGHAGVQCALACAEGGRSVAVVERQSREKMRWLGEQIGHVNSRFLIERGFGPYDTGAIVQEFCRQSLYRVNASLIAAYVTRSGEMVDHLLSLIPPGCDLLEEEHCNVFQAYGSPEYPIERCGHRSWAGTLQLRGRVVTDRDERVPMMSLSRLSELEGYAKQRSEALGAVWRHRETGVVLTREQGRVTGAISRHQDGRYIRYRARRAVALCCGDFGQNEEMVRALLEEAAELAQVRGIDRLRAPGRDGSGHRMGVWAGGRMEAGPRASMLHMGFQPIGDCGLWLNCEGRRYANEGAPQGPTAATLRQKRGMVYSVTDRKWLRQMQVCHLNHGAPDFGRPEYIQQCVEDMDRVAAAGAAGYDVRLSACTERMKTKVYGAATLEELAEHLQVPARVRPQWLASIQDYNRMCREGVDRQFGKDPRMMIPIDQPPYYATCFDSHEMDLGLCTLAGLVCDERMNVLDEEDRGIPGLYAAGNCLGGRYAVHYETPIAGNSIGMAMTHGRILGSYLAETRT